jgi:hypothetical protein
MELEPRAGLISNIGTQSRAHIQQQVQSVSALEQTSEFDLGTNIWVSRNVICSQHDKNTTYVRADGDEIQANA